nr:hypothetical protein [Tanacetum cinerariifolium]
MRALKITAERMADCGDFKPMMLSAPRAGIATMNSAGTMAKYLATSLAMLNVVYHVAGFFGGLGARVHGDSHVGLGQGGRVVGTVAHHRHQLAALLLGADVLHLVLRLGFGNKVIDTCFFGNKLGGERVVA